MACSSNSWSAAPARAAGAVVFAAFIVLMAPDTAAAATVALDRLGDPQYRAAAGETNTAVFTLGPERETPRGARADMTVVDSTAPLAAGRGCQQLSADTVICAEVGGDVDVDLGNGDDSAQLALPDASARVSGGLGNDRLTATASGFSARLSGGPGDDVLTGGKSNDELFGGGGRDELHGGGGGDYLRDGDREGAVDADVLDGGVRACADYSSRTRPLHVDLADPGPDGEVGEGDQLSGVTQISGGRGDDVLVGTSAAERFAGGGGLDRIYARGGNDYVALIGRERVVGGPGRDRVDYFTDPCGRTSPEPSGPGAWLSKSCDLLVILEASDCGDRIAVRPRPLSVSRSGRLVFRLPCQYEPMCRKHRTRLTLTTGRAPVRVVADVRAEVHQPGRAVAVQLTSSLAERARQRPVRLRARLTGPDGCEGRWSEAWRFDVRVPR